MTPEDQAAFEDWYFSDSSNQCGHPEEIAKNAFEAGMALRDAQPAAAVNKDVLQAAAKLAHDLRDLISESQGVAGLHKNGELADWESLTRGGRFESWLTSLDELDEALIEAGNHAEPTPAVAQGEPDGWHFKFNSGAEPFVTNVGAAGLIKLNLRSSESCTEYFKQTPAVAVNQQLLRALKLILKVHRLSDSPEGEVTRLADDAIAAAEAAKKGGV